MAASEVRPACPPRPRASAEPGGARPEDVQAAWWVAHLMFACLVLLLSGSWRSAPAHLLHADPAASADVPEPSAARAPEDVARALAAAVLGPELPPETPPALPARPPAPAPVRVSDEVRALLPSPGETLLIDNETLWLARCMYSESNLPHEQELVAWVVRNRVATRYRGQGTFRDVVLDPQQFSAFNAGAPRRDYYLSLTPESRAPGWRLTLAIAAYVRRAPWSQMPFGVGVRHFYSEVSMVGRRHPTWAVGETPVEPDRLFRVDPYRFRFLDLSRER